MTNFKLYPIGKVRSNEQGAFIELDRTYFPALKALDGFTHINVLWWASDFDKEEYRSVLTAPKPYKNAPDEMGIFATRSPIRPNPIALTPVEVISVNEQDGIIQIAYIDAHDQTPVLDLKPYTPSYDRVESADVPAWCRHWPKTLEQSAAFDWEPEFNF